MFQRSNKGGIVDVNVYVNAMSVINMWLYGIVLPQL